MEMQIWDKIQEGTHGKKGSADAVSAEQWKSTKLPNFRSFAQISTMPKK
jgi:hypothetical protein